MSPNPPSPARPVPARSVLSRVLRDPLTVFVVLGAFVFLVDAATTGGDEDRRVVVDDATLTRIGDQWQMQAGRAPTAQELEGLVDDYVQEEILYREAMKMGLDRDDVIVRRRLAQKLKFLSEDLSVPGEPTEAALRAYYDNARAQYSLPDRLSFSHVYVSAERSGGGGAAHAEAQSLQKTLEHGGEESWRNAGDPFILSRSYAERTVDEIRDLFGAEFAASLAGLEAGPAWQGPVTSAYGSHLVRLEARIPARELAFEEVEQRVRDDYLIDERKTANEAFYRTLRARYQVERVDRGGG